MGFFNKFKHNKNSNDNNGGGGDIAQKKESKKKSKEQRRHLKKKRHHHRQAAESKPKIGTPKRAASTPPPQKVYISAANQGVDSSAPRRVRRNREPTFPLTEPPRPRRPPPPVMAPEEPLPQEPPHMTFREYLAGVRLHNPTSPNRPASQQQLAVPQQVSQAQPKAVQKQVLSPVAPPKPIEARKMNESEKRLKKPDPDLTVVQKIQAKSTEKIEETAAASPKPQEHEQHQSENAKTIKQREAERMTTFFRTFLKKDCSELDTQFEKLRSYVPKSFTRYLFDENQEKCRFADIICMDQTRVVLEDCAAGEFIHANWIQMNKENFTERFIIAQFPISETIFDFWHMVWPWVLF